MAIKMDDLKHTFGGIKDSVAGTLQKGVSSALDAAHLQKKTPFGGKLLFLAAGLGVGATIGAGVALLLTPMTGKQLRLVVKHYATKLVSGKPKAAAEKLTATRSETEAERLNSHNRRTRAPAELATQPS